MKIHIPNCNEIDVTVLAVRIDLWTNELLQLLLNSLVLNTDEEGLYPCCLLGAFWQKQIQVSP